MSNSLSSQSARYAHTPRLRVLPRLPNTPLSILHQSGWRSNPPTCSGHPALYFILCHVLKTRFWIGNTAANSARGCIVRSQKPCSGKLVSRATKHSHNKVLTGGSVQPKRVFGIVSIFFSSRFLFFLSHFLGRALRKKHSSTLSARIRPAPLPSAASPSAGAIKCAARVRKLSTHVLSQSNKSAELCSCSCLHRAPR